jgi:hypothetical protein
MLIPFKMQAQTTSLSTFLPDNIEGWKIDDTDKVYNSETLYDYIDGGAELYLSYGMNAVISRRYSKEGVGEIQVEIFDMIWPKNAFGVYTHTRTIDEKRLGQGSQYFTGAQIFWKDKYYITVIANNENDEIKSAIAKISADIDNKIATQGSMPEIIKYLPEEHLQKDGFIYFHHYIWQNSFYFISNDNFLNITERSDALLAKYGVKDKRSFLLLIDYDVATDATNAYSKFKELFMTAARDGTTAKMNDGNWLGCILKDTVLVCIFKAETKSNAQDLLDNTIKKIKQ